MIIAPRNGMVIIDPATRKPMPVAGIERKALDSYWQRRLNCGDVVLVEAQPQPLPPVVEQTQTLAPALPATPVRTRNRRKPGEGRT